MKSFLISLLILFFLLETNDGQTNKSVPPPPRMPDTAKRNRKNLNNIQAEENKWFYDKDGVLQPYIEKPASFPGGNSAWLKFLQQNLVYPNYDLKNNIQGVVRVQMVVDKDGSVAYVQALNDPGGGLAEEAIRVVKLSPKWVPANQGGRIVTYRLVQSITFGIPNSDEPKPRINFDDLKIVLNQYDTVVINNLLRKKNYYVSKREKTFYSRIIQYYNKDTSLIVVRLSKPDADSVKLQYGTIVEYRTPNKYYIDEIKKQLLLKGFQAGPINKFKNLTAVSYFTKNENYKDVRVVIEENRVPNQPFTIYDVYLYDDVLDLAFYWSEFED